MKRRIDQNTSEGGGGSIVGINEGWELADVSYGGTKKDGTGTQGLILHWKKGSFNWNLPVFDIDEAKQIEFYKKYPRTVKRKGESVTLKPEEAFQLEIDDQNKWLKHIATKFVPERDFIVEGDDFESFCKSYIAVVKPRLQGKQNLRLKVVYNHKDMFSLPKYPPFIEDATLVSAKDSKLKITDYDKTEKEMPDTEEATPATTAAAPKGEF